MKEAGCWTGKCQYDTRAQAMKAMRYAVQRRANRVKGLVTVPFWCHWCQHWHLGRQKRGST